MFLGSLYLLQFTIEHISPMVENQHHAMIKNRNIKGQSTWVKIQNLSLINHMTLENYVIFLLVVSFLKWE